MNENKLKIKDLVNIGIFSTIYMVVSLLTMVLAMFSPIIWLLWPSIAGLVCSFVYMFLVTKVPKRGTALLLSLITGLIYFISGECTWTMLMSFAIVGVLAEITRAITGYKSVKGAVISSGILAMGFIGSPLPMWLFQESYMKSIIDMGMDPKYVSQLKNMISIGSLIGCLALAFVVGMIGGIIGKVILKKHFEKAGLI
ncbi:TIGR02185 family protein [Eubacterium nodatum ATCC 33099]|nr:TIGR02185 family protein [Eubacterium nodatum ATCC 33099]